MIKAKTVVSLLRRLGIVLIALPEPITTPFGVALGLTAHYLSRRLEASLNKRLRETLKNYLAKFKRFSDYADSEASAPGEVKRYFDSEEHMIPRQYKGSVGPNPSYLVRQSWRGMKDDGSKVVPGNSRLEVISGSTKKLIHHSIDMQMLFRRYGMKDDGSKVVPGAPCSEVISGSTKKLVHHSIDMQMLFRRYGMVLSNR
jgi:hypothetical protein